MASITTEGRAELIALYIAMFKAAPGATNLSEIVTLKESGKTLVEVANFLTGKADFSKVYPAFLTADEFAARLVTNLLGSEVSAGASTWATNWVKTQLAAGKGPAFIMSAAVQAIRSTSNTDFANAKSALANQTEVATYYSVTKEQSSTDLATLQAVINGVTSTASTVTTAKTNVDTGVQVAIGKTYTLTTGIDTVAGAAGNDTIIGNNTATPSDTFTSLDNIDGGAGDDTFTITSTAAVSIPTTATVKNVEKAVITSAKDISGDVSGWTGLTSLTAVSATSATTNQSLTAGAADVAFTTVYTDAGTGAASTTGTIAITGGKSVSLTSTIVGELGATFDTTQGAITVTGTADTTSVSVSQTAPATGAAAVRGVINGDVTITDVNSTSTTAAGKITTVTLSNWDDATVNSGALTTANLSGKAATFNAGTLGALTTAANSTFALNLTGLTTTGAVTFDTDIKTLNVSSATAASSINTLTNGSLTALNISGDKGLTVTTLTAAATAVITSTNTGGVTITSALGTTQQFVGTSSGGADSISIAAAGTKAITTGAGNDTVTYAGALATGGSIDAGDGSDTIKMTDTVAATATATATFAGTVSNFEVLEISNATTAATAINMANADGMNSLTTNGVGAGFGLTVTNAGADFTFTQKAAMANASSIALATDTGTSDNVNLKFTANDGFTNTTALTVSNVESLTITLTDANTTANTALFVAPITAAAAKTVTVSGNAGIDLTGLTATTITSLDASGLTAATFGGLTWTSGALAAAATVKGSAAGANTIDFSAATKAVTYTGGTGVDTLNWTTANTQANVISLGNGANVINGGTNMNGNNTITTGTGNDTISLGSGMNTVDVGSGTDAVTVGTAPVNGNSYSSITGLGGTGDTLVLKDQGTEVFTSAKLSLASTAAFRDYLDAAASSTTANTNATIKWFQYGGDTYVVQDLSASASFSDGADLIVKLVGLVDLSTATTSSTNTITFA